MSGCDGCDGVCEAELALALPSFVTAMLGELLELEPCDVLIGLGPLLLSSDERVEVPGTVRCLALWRGGIGAANSPCGRCCGGGSLSSQSVPEAVSPCRMDASRRLRCGSPLSCPSMPVREPCPPGPLCVPLGGETSSSASGLSLSIGCGDLTRPGSFSTLESCGAAGLVMPVRRGSAEMPSLEGSSFRLRSEAHELSRSDVASVE